MLSVFVLASALAIYPGELSWLSPRLHSKLYDAAASRYEGKWLRHDYSAYDQLLLRSCESVAADYTEGLRVLDLCAGTGRATEVMASALGVDTEFVCVDASPGMLATLGSRLAKSALRHDQIQVFCDDAGRWIQKNKVPFHLVAMMECSEFLPQFPSLVTQLSNHLKPGAVVVTTRPAGLYGWAFPGRSQSTKRYHDLFIRQGFSLLSDTPWRSRYRLVAWQFNRHRG